MSYQAMLKEINDLLESGEISGQTTVRELVLFLLGRL